MRISEKKRELLGFADAQPNVTEFSSVTISFCQGLEFMSRKKVEPLVHNRAKILHSLNRLCF
jgi:hypothetical protein